MSTIRNDSNAPASAKSVDRDQVVILRGTLDMLVLSTLSDEPMHGYAIALAIQKATDDALSVAEGTLYPALYRIEDKGWVRSRWGRSEANRRARYYRITSAGRKHLAAQTAGWESFVDAVRKVIQPA